MFVQRLIWRVFQADENIFVDSFTEKVCAVQAFIAGCVCRADREYKVQTDYKTYSL